MVVNNQLGFTATDRQSRSSRYASDFMKTIAAPVLHVNAEVPEVRGSPLQFSIGCSEGVVQAVVAAGRIATEYRQRFGKDVMVDLIGYRRYADLSRCVWFDLTCLCSRVSLTVIACRWGHNELDEPAFTQPLMYQNIRSRPSIVRIYREVSSPSDGRTAPLCSGLRRGSG